MNTFDEVKLWNQKVNKYPSEVGTPQYWADLTNQAKRIEEELIELVEGINERDITKVVDSGLDLDVVVSGLNYLNCSNYQLGISQVLNNNDLKYTVNKDVAEQWKFYWESNGESCEVQESTVNKITYYSLHRTSDNKVMKFAKFPEVDLTDVVPNPITEQYILVRNKEVVIPEELQDLSVLFLEQLDDQNGVLETILDSHNLDLAVLGIRNGEMVDIQGYEEPEE